MSCGPFGPPQRDAAGGFRGDQAGEHLPVARHERVGDDSRAKPAGWDRTGRPAAFPWAARRCPTDRVPPAARGLARCGTSGIASRNTAAPRARSPARLSTGSKRGHDLAGGSRRRVGLEELFDPRLQGRIAHRQQSRRARRARARAAGCCSCFHRRDQRGRGHGRAQRGGDQRPPRGGGHRAATTRTSPRPWRRRPAASAAAAADCNACGWRGVEQVEQHLAGCGVEHGQHLDGHQPMLERFIVRRRPSRGRPTATPRAIGELRASDAVAPSWRAATCRGRPGPGPCRPESPDRRAHGLAAVAVIDELQARHARSSSSSVPQAAGGHQREQPHLRGAGLACARPGRLSSELRQETADRSAQAADDRHRNQRIASFQVGQLDQGGDFFGTFDRAQRQGHLETHRATIGKRRPAPTTALRKCGEPANRGAARRMRILAHVRVRHRPTRAAACRRPVATVRRAIERRAPWLAAAGSEQRSSQQRRGLRIAALDQQPLGRVAPPAIGRFEVLDQLGRRLARSSAAPGAGGQVFSRRLTFQMRPWPVPLPPVDPAAQRSATNAGCSTQRR